MREEYSPTIEQIFSGLGCSARLGGMWVRGKELPGSLREKNVKIVPPILAGVNSPEDRV